MSLFENFLETHGAVLDIDPSNGRCRTSEGVKRIHTLPMHVSRPLMLRAVEMTATEDSPQSTHVEEIGRADDHAPSLPILRLVTE